MSDKQKNFFLLLMLLIVSALVRFYGIGRQSYWIDELVSVHFAKSSISSSVLWDNVPFFYHLILKGWIRLTSDDEFFTRLLSLLFSVGATGVLWRLGLLLAGFWGAFSICLLQIFMPLSILYAQETRMYALFEFLSALSGYSFYQFIRYKKSGLLYAISTSVMCITHYLAIIPLMLQALWFIAQTKKDQKIWMWGAIGLGIGGIAIAISYWVFFSWPHLDWQRLKFEVEPSTRWPGEVLWVLLGGSWISISGYFILLVFIVKSMKFKMENDLWFFFSFTIIPLIIFQSIVFGVKRSVFLPRYFIYLIPYFLPWVFLSLKELYKSNKVALYFVVTLIGVGTLQGLPNTYVQTKAPWREVAKTVSEYSNTVVLTTRTNAIRTPYFERISADVEKWAPNDEGIKKIIEFLDKGKSVWLVENYWGGLTYLGPLKSNLDSIGLHWEEKIHKIENSEPLLTLRIYR